MPLWEGFAPQSGFLPLLYGIALVGLSAAIVVSLLTATEAAETRDPIGKPLLVLGALAATVIGLEAAGFAVAIFVLLLFLFVIVERLPVLASIVVASVDHRHAGPAVSNLARRPAAEGRVGDLSMGPLFDLMQGFASALTPTHLGMCVLGVMLGQIIGVLPGIGPAAAIALLLPLAYGSSPTAAIILFAGIYYGAQYGGTLTSVLISVPGEPSTVMTSHRRLPDGAAGPRRRGARHRRDRFVHRRHAWHPRSYAAGAAARPRRARLRAAGVFRARFAWTHRLGGGGRLCPQRVWLPVSADCCWGPSASIRRSAYPVSTSAACGCSTASSSSS